jgi:rRNA maturation endonuclease Nob1
LRERAASKVKVNWMETRTVEVSQYHCTGCQEIFQFASDKHGTERPPVACPMCGSPTK